MQGAGARAQVCTGAPCAGAEKEAGPSHGGISSGIFKSLESSQQGLGVSDLALPCCATDVVQRAFGAHLTSSVQHTCEVDLEILRVAEKGAQTLKVRETLLTKDNYEVAGGGLEAFFSEL